MQTLKVRIDHINMTVKNLEESVAWYEKIFQFQKVEQGVSEGQPWAIIRNENSLLCLYQEPNRVAAPEGDNIFDQFHRLYHFGLNVDSSLEWEKIVQLHKIKVMYGGAIRYPHSTSWYVEDPSGYEIEVSHWNNENQITF
ncbi:MAG: VOC family protein [Bacteriovoracaceae bacterium]